MIDALHAAIYAKLDTALSVPIYSAVPQGDAEPAFVTMDGFRANRNDTDTETGFDGTIDVHVWTEYEGWKELCTLQTTIYNAMHRTALTVTGHAVIDVQQEFSEMRRDPDGITKHGIQRFRVIIEAV